MKEIIEMIDMCNEKSNTLTAEDRVCELVSKSSQTSSPIINEINSRKKLETNNVELSIIPSNLRRGGGVY